MSDINRQVVLTGPLTGVPSANDFAVREAAIPALAAGQFLLKHKYIALDPWQRSAIAGRHSPHGTPMVKGDMPPAEVVGQVMTSKNPDFPVDAWVRVVGGWQEYSVSDGTGAAIIDAEAAPLSTHLGILGMPGLTAWASIIRLANVQAGQTVLVSAALGPVGSMVGQIAIQKGARAIGLAGSDEKCRLVLETGFSHCINYKTGNYVEELRAVMPDGADIYHDNVGGQMLIDACGLMKEYGTVILCGLISQYNDAASAVNLPVAIPIMKRLVMKGLVVYDHNEAHDDFFTTVAPWVQDGRVKYFEDRAEGIAQTGAQFARLMQGKNVGKSLIVLS